jgi:hypothetical protein
MERNGVSQEVDFEIGDQVALVEKKSFGGEGVVPATILEIRYILGKQTYVIETTGGKRRVVGASQVTRLEK